MKEMKNVFTIIFLYLLLVSCATEEHVVHTVPEDNLVTNTALKNKLLQVLQSPTAIDNFIDGSGCFAIVFPYTVTVNGTVVSLASEADYQQVYDLMNAGGGNSVELQFPLTVRYADYTEITFTTQAQFNDAVSSCSASTELSCMDFSYPVGVKTYNSDYQLAESFSISSKESLYEFVNNLDVYDAVVFDYPVDFNLPDGSTIAITGNDMLEQQIDTYTQQCLDGLAFTSPQLQDVIVQGTWYVSYYFFVSDQTTDYNGYNFAFSSGGNITVTGTGTETGTWVQSQSGSTQQLVFTFTGSGLNNLAQTWNVSNVTQNLIQLEIPASGVEPARYLYLAKD